MQKYGVNELRRMFLEFFESKDHLVLKSFSLVPHNDKKFIVDQFRYGTNEAILYRTGDPAEKKSDNLSEVYPYRRYRECR